MRFTWDPDKNQLNVKKHGLSFATARHVFDDDLRATRDDPFPHEERWQTIGKIGPLTIFVVFAYEDDPLQPDDPLLRIITARPASGYERRAYEERDF